MRAACKQTPTLNVYCGETRWEDGIVFLFGDVVLIRKNNLDSMLTHSEELSKMEYRIILHSIGDVIHLGYSTLLMKMATSCCLRGERICKTYVDTAMRMNCEKHVSV